MSDATSAGDEFATAAAEYAGRGWKVILLRHVLENGLCSCGSEDGPDEHAVGKHPVSTRWPSLPAPSAADAYAMFEGGSGNIGIATGEASGFFVLDVDPKHDGDERLQELIDEHGPLPETYTVRTGSGGRHYFLLMPDFHVGNSSGTLPDGLDIRGTGGQVVAPPSVSGVGAYVVESASPLAAAPEWLLAHLRPKPRPKREPSEKVARAPEDLRRYSQRAFESEVQKVASATLNRNDQLNESTFLLATIAAHDDSGLDIDDVREAMEQVGLSIGLTSLEVPKTVASAIKGGLSKPREPWPPERKGEGFFIPFEDGTKPWPMRRWDDLGNADRMVDHYGERLRWVPDAGRWAAYADGKWTLDLSGSMAQTLVQEMFERLGETEALSYSDAPQVNDDGEVTGPSEREEFLNRFVKKQRFSTRVKAALEATRGKRVMTARLAEFDADPLVVNCRNGILDLRTGKLTDHDPSRLTMMQVAADYDPDAQCPKFMAYLERVHPEPEMRAFLQRSLGYSLTGDTSEQVMWLHYGVQRNGKSVMLELMSDLLDGYSQVVPRATLLVKRDGGIPNDVARMVGKRFLQTSETAPGRHLDEEVVKSLTGGERVTARFMRAEFFDFKPTGKLHYVTNHKPRLSNSESIWRRLLPVEWSVVIPEDEAVKGLARLLYEDEASGVLAWLVAGARSWMEHGLMVPSKVLAARDEYRDEEDIFGDFIEQACMQAPEHFETTKDLLRAYQRWAHEYGLTRTLNEKDFGMSLNERGYKKTKRKQDGRQLRGYIGLKPEAAYLPLFGTGRDG